MLTVPGRRERDMLMDDLPAAIALSLEHVREPRGNGGPRRPGGHREHLGSGADEGVRPDDLDLAIRNPIVLRLRADEVARPAGLDLAVRRESGMGRIEHHRSVRILA